MNPRKNILPTDAGNLRQRRLSLGLNQTDFWQRLAVEQSVGSRYENGRDVPRPTRLLLEMAYGPPQLAAEIFRTLRGNVLAPYLIDLGHLREYRQARGLSLSNFWSVLGIQRSVASRYETQRQPPQQVATLLELAYGEPNAARQIFACLRHLPMPDLPMPELARSPRLAEQDRQRVEAVAPERRRSSDRRQVNLPLPPWQADRRKNPDRRLAS